MSEGRPSLADFAGDPETLAPKLTDFGHAHGLERYPRPEDLGKLTVRMRLTGTRLNQRGEAERLETMQLIWQGKGSAYRCATVRRICERYGNPARKPHIRDVP